MKKYCSILLLFVSLFSFSCRGWLDRDSLDIITSDQIYESKGAINSVIAGIYERLPDWGGIYQDGASYTHLDEGMLGQNVNNLTSYAFSYAAYYNVTIEGEASRAERAYPYSIIRDINYHINQLKTAPALASDEKSKAYYIAEARFMRAYIYFELVKRMGGVPLLTEPLVFEDVADVAKYQVERSKESDIYDFIAKEMDEIKEDLDLPLLVQYNRASKGAALALKCRAMLYAGTLAKYNSQMAIPVTLPGGEVGIPAERAESYLKSCLDAAEELMLLGYELYDVQTDKSRNFYEALIKPAAENKEIIFCKEFSYPSVTHDWTYNNLPRTLREGGFGGVGGCYINPSLNLVDAYEMKDGSDGKIIPYTDANHPDETGTDAQIDGNPEAYRYYDTPFQIFENKDPRLSGTILLPGASLGGKALDLKAGIALFDEASNKLLFKVGAYTNYPDKNKIVLDGKEHLLTGQDGPTNQTYATRTGFYVRKSVDEQPNADAKKSATQFVRYRLAEVYLNAAEAAFELGETDKAQQYLKKVRDRAGISTSSAVTLDQIRNERRVELAFEGHRYFDLKRWRVATELFDGNVSNPGAMIYGLWPYQVYRPGHETHEKWIFVRRIPGEFRHPRKFVWANYYSKFPDDALATNPKLVKNPGH